MATNLAPSRGASPRRPAGRVQLGVRTLRQDRWWLQPAITVGVLLAFIAYSTWAAFQNRNYFADPYISPFFSPCLTTACKGDTFPKLFTGPSFLSPALYILIVPLGFRLTCYYYRKAYYRSFWASPPACSVAEPHKSYSGETRFPLVFQNAHRYFFYLGLVFNLILSYDAVRAFDFPDGFGFGLGTAVLLVNAVLLWMYSLSCHSCRHIVGGRLNNFGKHPYRYKAWTWVSRLNARHMQLAWASLIFVALTDVYVRLVASGAFSDPRLF